MKLSVFTPAHQTRYLDDAYASLRQQTCPDWEWVLLLNGVARNNLLSADLRADERVRIFEIDSVKGVGDAKALCLEYATGDVFLELDHDDLLHPEACAEVQRVMQTGVSFVYSNTCRMSESGDSENTEYNCMHGWSYRSFYWKEKSYKECVSFPPSPQAMSYIWYMPNHLRAFNRALYDKSGGYNRSRFICDDQELMQRMYILDSRFHHIDLPLYFQRIHQEQTQVVHNAAIQSCTVELYHKYIADVALSWARQYDLLALDMGGAHRKPKGFLGVDKGAGEGVDIIADANERLPFPDNSVGVIRAVDFLEHIRNPVHIMNEFHRVLVHGGMLLSSTPSTDGRGAFQDPTHVSFWNENSFWYYTRKHMRDFVPEITARFQASYVGTGFPDEFCLQHNIAYVTANLSAVKDGGDRLPGVLEI